jgi:hypothetical protein
LPGNWTVEHVRRERQATDHEHTLPHNMAAGLERVQAPKVIIVEDDDWYAPGYLSATERRLDEYDLVGEGQALYVLLTPPHVKCMNNMGHASWAAMGFKGAALEFVRAFVPTFRDAFLDLHTWRNFHGSKKVYPPAARRRVGGPPNPFGPRLAPSV